jgi:hypothetical protein
MMFYNPNTHAYQTAPVTPSPISDQLRLMLTDAQQVREDMVRRASDLHAGIRVVESIIVNLNTALGEVSGQ